MNKFTKIQLALLERLLTMYIVSAVVFIIFLIVISVFLSGCAPQTNYVRTSCTTKKVDNVTTMTCTDGTKAVITDGIDAEPYPYSPVGIVTPCGPSSSPFKEVLLILEDGSLLASFSDTQSGDNTRFALIPDGTYMDTDSSGCVFTISTKDNVRTVTWNNDWHGGSQSWTIKEAL